MRSGRQGDSLRAHSPTIIPPGGQHSTHHRLPTPSSTALGCLAHRRQLHGSRHARNNPSAYQDVAGRRSMVEIRTGEGNEEGRACAAVPPGGGKVGGERPSLRRRCRTSDPGQAGAAIQVVGISTPRRLIDGIWACACVSLARGNSCVWGTPVAHRPRHRGRCAKTRDSRNIFFSGGGWADRWVGTWGEGNEGRVHCRGVARGR
jgi:hypothetical protein